jgi:cell division protein FtsW (lipid II flippase)
VIETSSQLLWTLLALGLFCSVQAVRDLRRRNYPMAALAALCVLLILLVPVQTHAVKVDFPAPPSR